MHATADLGNSKNNRVQNNGHKETDCLCLRVPNFNSKEYIEAKLLVDVFEGNSPLVIYLSDEKRYVKAPRNMWVELNPVLENELKRRIGQSNVVVKKMKV